VNTSLRDIDVHLLYYKDPLLGFTADTAFIYVFIAHLKAGSEAYDEQVRAAMTSDLMNWLDNINQAGNYVLCGDFNLKSNAEQAWYNLTSYPNSAIVFHDPAQMEGSWTGNPAFQTVHSQSTHLNGNSCASGGGLDDRFDFIMLSEQIMEGDEHYQYQEGSYNVLGQDGLRLNGSVLSPANTEVPEEIAWALYDASDHLPVVVDLLVDQHWTGLNSRPEYESIAIWIQHFNQASVSLGIRDPSPLDLAVSIYSMTGEIAQRAFFTTAPGSSTCQLDVPSLAPGMYVMQISDGSRSTVLKFMKP
jgi:exonuclease III